MDGRVFPLQILGAERHHALHHDPKLMQKWNFNVSLPLWEAGEETKKRIEEQVAQLELLPKR